MMTLGQRAAIGGEIILPALNALQGNLRTKLGAQLGDDDLVFATVWAAVRHSAQTTGGAAAIERLRDVLDEIEASGAFGDMGGIV